MINENHKETSNYLNYVEHFIILASAVTGYISISAFTSLVCLPLGITTSLVGLKNFCVMAEGMKDYKSIQEKEEEA